MDTTIAQEAEIMNTHMTKTHKLAANDPRCIFKVSQSLLEMNKEAYQPQLVSIGPYHHANKDLEMMEDHKWRLLHDFIARTGKPLELFLNIMVSMEENIRQSYSESVEHFSSNYLAKMMVLDGVFLIELFRKVGRLIPIHPDDPVFGMTWVSPFLMMDLLRIENQIPFFVLQRLFDESKNPSDPTLARLILEFFNYATDRPRRVLERYYLNLEGKHLLDFLRKSFINHKNVAGNEMSNSLCVELIPSATELDEAGVMFKRNAKADSFLDIKFRDGFLSIPELKMDEFHSTFLLNSVAFEQRCLSCSKDITTYVVFMGILMKTSDGVGVVSLDDIVKDGDGRVKLLSDAGRGVSFNARDNYLLELALEVKMWCKMGRPWPRYTTQLKRTYFRSPWAAILVMEAFTLVTLAFIQTIFTVGQYYQK